MSFYDLPKVKIPKEILPLKGMSKELARKKFAEKCALKKKLRAKLNKCDKDLTKYYLTYSQK